MQRDTELILGAIRKAMAAGGEHLLFKMGKQDGLFASRSGPCADAASFALDREFLVPTRQEGEGKKLCEFVRVSAKGIRFLHERESPARALDEALSELRREKGECAGGVSGLQQKLGDLSGAVLEFAHAWSAKLEALERRIEDAIVRMEQAVPLVSLELQQQVPWSIEVVRYLQWRRVEGEKAQTPLPELFELVRDAHPEINLVGFHEGLRKLLRGRMIRLESASDLTALPRPEFALLEGPQVYYYASR